MVAKIEISTRAQQVKYTLLEMLQNRLITGNKLPSEEELTKLLGVSLATLREALLELNKEGVISKRHGSGNFIHQSTLQTRMRIDRFADFKNLLEDGGYEVKIAQSEMRLTQPDQATASALKIAPNTQVVSYDRLFYTGEKLAIISNNIIPSQYFVRDLAEIQLEPNLAEFVWKYCQKEIAHGIFEFIPALIQAEDSILFGLNQGVPMTSWEEIFYTLEDDPICLSKVRFNPGIVKMKMLWKWGQKL